MNKATAILGTALLIGGAASAEAKNSSGQEFRGFEKCIDAVEQTLNGVVPARDYLISRSTDVNQYFINTTAWSNGERAQFRVACDTTRSGRRLLDVSVNEGVYVLDEGEVTVRVAAN